MKYEWKKGARVRCIHTGARNGMIGTITKVIEEQDFKDGGAWISCRVKWDGESQVARAVYAPLTDLELLTESEEVAA